MTCNIRAKEVCAVESKQKSDLLLLKTLSLHIELRWMREVNIEGVSYIHMASAFNCLEIIKIILSRESTTVNVESMISAEHAEFPGFTALHFATLNGHADAVDLLLQHTNASVCPVNQEGLSHLHICCVYGTVQHVKGYIVSKSIDINARISDTSLTWPGYTALHVAAECERYDVVYVLLRAGADPNMRDKDGLTPLHVACRLSDFKIRMVYLKQRQKNVERIEWMAGRDQELVIDTLLWNNARVNPRDKSGKTPMLHLFNALADFNFKLECSRVWPNDMFYYQQRYPLRFRRLAIFNRLLHCGADIHAVDNDGFTILHHLVTCCCYTATITETLMSRGFDINARTRSGLTPLFLACKDRMNWQNIVFLLKKGADPNAAEHESQCTPFIYYALNTREYMLTKFIKHGADLRHRLSNGKTVLHVLFSRTTDEGYDAHHSCLQRMLINALERIQILLGVDDGINAQDSAGRTPLHYACLRKDANDTNILIRHGADIDVTDNDGKTPLEYNPQIEFLVLAGFLSYARKLKRAGVCNNESNKSIIAKLIEDCEWYTPEVEEEELEAEKQEITKLKCTRIDRYTSLYKFLSRSPSELALHARNCTVTSFFNKRNFLSGFPRFGDILLYQYRKGMAREKIIKPARESLSTVTTINMPDYCWERILDFLDDKSIENVIAMHSWVTTPAITV